MTLCIAYKSVEAFKINKIDLNQQFEQKPQIDWQQHRSEILLCTQCAGEDFCFLYADSKNS